MDLYLDGSVVLITGGTDGLGAALAGRLVEEGARVAVCGRDPERLDQARAELEALGGDVLAVRADISRADQVQEFVAATARRWGRIDGVVNNAGRSAGAGIENIPDDEWTADLELKVLGAARVVRAALPSMRAAGGGSIVNVLAISAKAAMANTMPSSASRAAGLAMTKSLSKELGPQGIRVNAVLIGIVESGQWRRQAAQSGQSEAELLANMGEYSGIPLGRVGRSGEFADLAAYLLSDRSSYVTGSAVNLDGGMSPVL
jgi:NAD(P)-dependent dehydrogenase (short-subunit alcohol dehydrogenase family)